MGGFARSSVRAVSERGQRAGGPDRAARPAASCHAAARIALGARSAGARSRSPRDCAWRAGSDRADPLATAPARATADRRRFARNARGGRPEDEGRASRRQGHAGRSRSAHPVRDPCVATARGDPAAPRGRCDSRTRAVELRLSRVLLLQLRRGYGIRHRGGAGHRPSRPYRRTAAEGFARRARGVSPGARVALARYGAAVRRRLSRGARTTPRADARAAPGKQPRPVQARAEPRRRDVVRRTRPGARHADRGVADRPRRPGGSRARSTTRSSSPKSILSWTATGAYRGSS